MIESACREGVLRAGVEGTGGEEELGFGALSRLVAVAAAATVVLSVTRVSSAGEEVEVEEKEGGLVLFGLGETAGEVLVISERGFLRGTTRRLLLASILTSGVRFPSSAKNNYYV